MSSNESTERRSPFSRSPFNKGPAGETPVSARPAAPASPAAAKPAGGRPPSPPRASKAEVSTMNRPDSTSLNANANATVAAQAFERRITESDYKPAIANTFIPPVIEKKEEAKTESPFKAAPKAPIKRPKGVTNIAYEEQKEEAPSKIDPGNSGPRIAQFIPIPVKEEPKSPFAPINKEETSSTQTQEETKPWNKTFVPLAPVPAFASSSDNNKNPFAAPVQKTEEQIKREEAAAQRALEESRTVGQKKSKLDKLMDELNKPIF